MKNLSKVLAVVLALVMALSMVSFAAYTDVAEDANYTEAVTVLSSLDMLKGYEDGTFKPEGEITRAEFAMVVCRLLGYGATAENNASFAPFNDVAADHWASGAIALASQQGIVNGYGNGNFGPEDPVTYEQAIKMVVAALGYTVVADANGGYPGGFQIVAAQTGILDGITDGKAGVAASRAVVAQLAYNALEVPMLAQTGFGTEVKYEYVNALLLNKIGVTKFYATVEGTAKSDSSLDANEVKLSIDKQITAIKGESEASKVAVDSGKATPDLENSRFDALTTTIKFDANSTIGDEATALLDYAVEVYVKDVTAKNPQLVAIAKRDVGNTEVVYSTEDINTDETVIDNNSTAADYSDDKVTTLAINADGEDYEEYDVNINKVYVNGRVAATGATAAALFASYTDADAEADIRILCNGTDEVYTIAYVTAYYDYVVDIINARSYKIVAKNAPTHPVMGTANATLILDEENEDFIFDIIKDGEKVDFSAIAENDVLSVAGGVNGNKELTFGTVVINTESVTGKVDGYSSDDATISIDGVAYPFTNIVWNTDVALGDEATFYINARGVICGLDEPTKSTNMKYGFATVAALSTGITNDTFEIRMMDAAGTWNTYVLASDAEVNGVDVDTITTLGALGTNVKNYDGTAAAATDAKGRLAINKVVGYELNADGAIKALYTYDDNDAFDLTAAATGAYNATTEMINGKTVTDATIIFAIDTLVASNTEIVDEDRVTVAAKANLVDRENYTLAAINTDDEGVPAVLFGADVVGRIDWTADFMVVSSINQRTNADNQAGVEITGIVAGEEVKVFASSATGAVTVNDVTYPNGDTAITTLTSATLGSIAKGDIIIYTTDAKGEAKKIVRLYEGADIKAMLELATPSVGANIKLGKKNVSGVDYTFYIGYVAEVKSSRIGLVDGADADAADYTGRTALTVKSDSIVTEVDFFYAGSKTQVKAGDIGSFNYDAGVSFQQADKDGDIVFIRAINETVVDEAVTFRAND